MLGRFVNYRIKRVWLVIVPCIVLLVGLIMGQKRGLFDARFFAIALPTLAITLRKHNVTTLLTLSVVAGMLGMWRGGLFARQLATYDLVAGHKVVLVGVANSDAVYGKQYQLTFDLRSVYAITPAQTPLIGNLTISGFGESAIFKGDIVQVSGSLRRTRGNNVAMISYGQLHVIAHGGSIIDTIRRKFNAGLQSALPEPAASFGLGLLVGQRNTLPTEISQQLMMVGLTHIIAVSGYNLTIILRAAGKLLGKRSKYQYVCFSILLMTLFLLFAGASPSIVRASVVCCLGLAAWYYGRTVPPVALLLVSAAITAMVNPLYAWGNVSWYLSFLAFFGVLVVAPLVTKRIYGKAEPKLVQAVLIESLCAEAMTLPYVLHIFGQMSTVGILANVLVVALTPLAMLLTLIAGLGGMFVPMVAGWVAWPATLVLTYMLDIASLLSRIPYAFIEHIGFSTAIMVFSYAIVAFVMYILKKRVRHKYVTITDKTDPAFAGEQH